MYCLILVTPVEKLTPKPQTSGEVVSLMSPFGFVRNFWQQFDVDGKYTYLLNFQELDNKTDTALVWTVNVKVTLRRQLVA